MSFDRIVQESPNAAKLLGLVAFFHPRDVWYELLAMTRRVASIIEVPQWLMSVTANEQSFQQTIEFLVRYAMVSEDRGSYSMHHLLHTWCLHMIPSGEVSSLYQVAHALISAMLPKDP